MQRAPMSCPSALRWPKPCMPRGTRAARGFTSTGHALYTRLSRGVFAPVLTLTAERQPSSLPIHAHDTFSVSFGLTRDL